MPPLRLRQEVLTVKTRYYAAPMEGVTGAMWRRTHQKYFPGADQYYTPFLTPTQAHKLTPREKRELLPEYNGSAVLVPQIMTRQAENFIWCAGAMGELGYEEVNLNLGCPSATVVTKGKGAGMLADLDALRRFLEGVFSAGLDMKISVKTRLGLETPEEFTAILAVLREFPLSELIVHPRVRRDMYTGPCRLEWYAAAAEESPFPVCYNGDVLSPGDRDGVLARFPQTTAVMVGRGLLADPALIRKLQGGPGADRDTLAAFVGELYEEYVAAFRSRGNAMLRMKEVWSYLLYLFDGGQNFRKSIQRCRDTGDYERTVEELFRTCPLRPEPELPWAGETNFGAK